METLANEVKIINAGREQANQIVPVILTHLEPLKGKGLFLASGLKSAAFRKEVLKMNLPNYSAAGMGLMVTLEEYGWRLSARVKVSIPRIEGDSWHYKTVDVTVAKIENETLVEIEPFTPLEPITEEQINQIFGKIKLAKSALKAAEQELPEELDRSALIYL